MDITTTDTSLLRLLQLSSVSLPVGGYAFSQGMEYAIDCGWLTNQIKVEDWISLQLHQSIARLDLPALRLCLDACQIPQSNRLAELNELILACRETKELRLNDTAMGEALGRLLTSLTVPHPFQGKQDASYICLFAAACHHWQITFDQAAIGFTWSWLENQVAAATKLVPLGQTQAQRLLGTLQQDIGAAITASYDIAEDRLGAGLPALAIASTLHETQYSRLFRS
ncbi:urease accessory protein UreF [Marinomonas epiphytica]